MLKKLKTIGSLLLLFVAFQAVGQSYVIDSVCVDTQRQYRMDGEAGSTYVWMLTDGSGNGVALSNPAGTPYTETDPVSGVTIVGTEVSVNWLQVGTYSLSAIQYSVFGCDTLEQGIVKVFEQPLASAGPNAAICPEEDYLLLGASASNYRSLQWTSSGDGTFDNDTILQPVYTPGPNDIVLGSATLTLTAHGLGSDSGCIPAVASLWLQISPLPFLVINDPPLVCFPETVDLTVDPITAGSEPFLTFTYWMDLEATVALASPDAVSVSGDYYVKATNFIGCWTVKQVKVVVNQPPVLVVTDPAPVCEGEWVDLTAPEVLAQSTFPTQYELKYWMDASASLAIADPTKILITGIYYIQILAGDGCSDIRPVTVLVNPLPKLVLTDPAPVCFPGPVDLTLAGVTVGSDVGLNFTYWMDAAATQALSNPQAVALSGDYYIEGTNATGCSSISLVKVEILPPPVLVITNPPDICEPNVVDLTATAITAGSDVPLIFTYWRDQQATLPLLNFTAVGTSGNYYIKGTNALGCWAVALVKVTVNPVPVLVITDPQPVCEPQTVDLTLGAVTAGSVIAATSKLSYWLDDLATQPMADPKAVSQSGTYYIRLESGVECFVIKPVKVTVHPEPVFTVTNPAVVCEPATVDLALTHATGQTLTFTYWQDALATVELPSPVVAGVMDRDYFIRAENEFGCFKILPVHVIINGPPVLVITPPAPACLGEVVDLISSLVINQSTLPPASILTYWVDDLATQPLLNPTAVSLPGIYYIRLEVGAGCFVVEPVEVIIHDLPVVKLNDPPAVCAPATVDLSLAAVTAGSDALVWSYWMDLKATQPLVNYAAVSVGGIYYIRGTNPVTGCGVTASVTVTIDQPITPTFDFFVQVCLNTPGPLLPAISTNNVTGSWSPAVVTTSALGTSTYRFTPDAGLCALPVDVKVSVVDGILPLFTQLGPYCYNSTPDNLPAVSSNGIRGIWDPSSVSTTKEGLTTYTFTPLLGECAIPTSMTILVYDRIFASLVPENVSSPAINDGKITVVGQTGGSGLYDYRLDNGSWQASPVFPLLAPGSYVVWMRERLVPQCPVSLGTEIINPSGTIAVSAVVTDVICYNGKDGSIVYSNALGGSGSYEYNIGQGWVAFTGSYTRSGLVAGSYTFRLRDAAAISKEISVVKTVNQPLPWRVTVSAVPSGFRTNLVATVVGSGGVPPYTYLWTGGQTTATALNLNPGTYTVTVTDAKGCQTSQTYKFGFQVEAQLIPALCPGEEPSVRIRAWDGPGTTYRLIASGQIPSQILPENQWVTVKVPASAIPYIFTIEDVFGIRAYTTPLLVTAAPPALSARVTGFPLTCEGNNGQIVLANLTGGASGTYEYRLNQGSWIAVPPAGTTVSNLSAGAYRVEIREPGSGCPPLGRDLVLQINESIALSALGTNALCFGDLGSIDFTFTNVPDGVYTITHSTGSLTGVQVTGNKARVTAPPGDYNNLVITYKACVSAPGVNVRILEGAQIVVLAEVLQPDCKVSTGSITVTSPVAAPGISYRLRGINPFVASRTNATGIFTGLTPGDYQVVVTNALGCTASLNLTINPALQIPGDPVLTILQPTCTMATGTITVTAPVAGNSYHLVGTDPVLARVSNTTGIFADLAAGAYALWTINADGCSSDTIPARIDPQPPTPDAPEAQVVHPDCFIATGSITVTSPLAAPGISYTLTGTSPVVAAQTNATGIFEPLAPGDYRVIVTNVWGCSSAPLNVTINPALQTPADPSLTILQPTCTLATGTIRVTGPVAGLSYWLAGTNPALAPISNTTGIFPGLAAGEYALWAINADGCSSDTIPARIDPQPPTPEVPEALVIQPNCFLTTGTITVSLPAPAAGISYTLIGTSPVRAAQSNTTGIFAGLLTGTYAVTATNADGCTSAPLVVIINAVPLPPARPVATVSRFPSCNNLDGSVLVLSPLGADLVYSMDGGPYQASPEFDGLKWGDHTFRVKDTLTQCVSPPVTVNVPPVPPSPLLAATWVNPKCFGDPGTILFTVVNHAASRLTNGNYTIQYTGGEFKNVRFTAGLAQAITAPAGSYRNLTLTNPATGCSSYDPMKEVNVNIVQPTEIVIATDSITEISLKSPRNGAIYIRVTGGTGSYKYQWSNGATTKDITNLTDGNYTVTVTDDNGCVKVQSFRIPAPNFPPVAVDDTYITGCKVIRGNVILDGMNNDSDPENDELFTLSQPVVAPRHGNLTLNVDGSFVYVADPLFAGIDSFVYVLYDKNLYEDITATVTLTIIPDMDADGIADGVDPDADGDGILNIYEILTGEAWLTADFDGDRFPNWLDIDADGDGIVDNIESQSWAGYVPPVVFDADSNGINDAYDKRQSGYEIIPEDTDKDAKPDFLDLDSENDGVPDFIEGHDENADGKPDHYYLGRDEDGDGLDDAYDTIFNDCIPVGNPLGSNASMQDFDGDGKPDWRDENDDDDAFLTIHEDLNGDNDWSNDNLDYDEHPEYLDYGRECDLFIPNAFSPNGDNIHDYFQIYCINHFPDAKIYIFDQLGNKLFEKANYGNLNVHLNYEDAWWSGKPNTGPAKDKGKLVAPGTYFYVLDLGNGEVKKSFVFVSY